MNQPLDPNESNPSVLWAEIHRLRSEMQGPRGFDTWYDAAVNERVGRVKSDAALKKLRDLLQNEIDHAAINDLRLTPNFGKMQGDMAIRIGSIDACLDNPETSVPALEGFKHVDLVKCVTDVWVRHDHTSFHLQSTALKFTEKVIQEIWNLPIKETDDDEGIPPGAALPETGEMWVHVKSNAFYTVLGITSKPDPEKVYKHPQSVYYEGPDGRRWMRALSSWFKSFAFLLPATKIADKAAKPTLSRTDFNAIVQALVLESERAIEQRDEYQRTGVSTAGHGGSHDTCFEVILRCHLDVAEEGIPQCTCKAEHYQPHSEACPVTRAVRFAFAASGESAQGDMATAARVSSAPLREWIQETIKASQWNSDERIKKLMMDLGFPNSTSHYSAFKQLEQEVRLDCGQSAWKDKTVLDGVYRERNQVVAALAKCFPSGIAKTAIEGWDEAWHNCVYIELPTGQVSWHYHDREEELFAGLTSYDKPWDGHDTEEKYRRLNALQNSHNASDTSSVRGIYVDLGDGSLTDGSLQSVADIVKHAISEIKAGNLDSLHFTGLSALAGRDISQYWSSAS